MCEGVVDTGGKIAFILYMEVYCQPFGTPQKNRDNSICVCVCVCVCVCFVCVCGR